MKPILFNINYLFVHDALALILSLALVLLTGHGYKEGSIPAILLVLSSFLLFFVTLTIYAHVKMVATKKMIDNSTQEEEEDDPFKTGSI